ncbi:hypothetical protein LR69_04372 [Geobacillus sp. BCO2]|nr:hypothetical protein LR69_04372 [Geobacillus sp. BCO2]
MKRPRITNDHGWTPRTLRKQERKIKKCPSSPTGDGGSPGHGRLFGQRGGLHGQRVPTNRFPFCVAVQRRRSGALASSGFRPRAGAVSHRRTAGRDQTACVDHHSRGNWAGTSLRRGTPNSCNPMSPSNSVFPFPAKRCENSCTVKVCHGLARRTHWRKEIRIDKSNWKSKWI